jgi:hypothetical protein
MSERIRKRKGTIPAERIGTQPKKLGRMVVLSRAQKGARLPP